MLAPHQRLIRLYPLLLGALVILSLAGCWGQRSPADEQGLRDAQATITALSTENARLATQAAAGTPVAVPQLPVPTVTTPPTPAQVVMTPTEVAPTMAITSTAVVTVAPVAASEANRAPLFPAIIADLPLAADQQTLVDFRWDQAANRFYVTDDSHLYVVDATSYTLLATLPVGGRLTLDAATARLFVAPRVVMQDSAAITVVDTQQLTVTALISNATHLTIDTNHQRFFVGYEQQTVNEQRGAPVRRLDPTTLAVLAESPHYGIPVYNTRRDDLLIVNGSVWVVNPTDWELNRDLLPEITQQPCIDCTGSLMVTSALLFPSADVLALSTIMRTTSGGPGVIPAPQFLQASTLEPLVNPALALQPTCGTQPRLRALVDERSYHALRLSRYTSSYNLLVQDSAGNLTTWRDGITPPFINANRAQAYADDWVLDLPTLTPLGALPAFCVFDYDPAQGLLFAARQHHLLVLSEVGGTPVVRANEDAILPAQPIRQIAPSPNFGQDQRLFVISGADVARNELYRSNDGGQTWLRLQQGLALSGDGRLILALSPAFATDQTLFLGGYTIDGRGLGVYRSTNSGDSWQPVWQGLQHLRVEELVMSPNYATDQTVVALARYDWLRAPFASGYSAQRSVDGGLSWTVAVTTATRSDLASLLPDVPRVPALPVRLGTRGQLLERTLDNGQSWQTVELSAPTDNGGIALVSAGDGQTGYLLGSHGVWRISGAGATVESWDDPRLQGLTLTTTLAALAVIGAPDSGEHRLLVGTNAGKIWVLDPAQLTWETMVDDSASVPANVPLPTVTPQPTITLTQPVTTPVQAITPTVMTAEPPADRYRPQGLFASVWERPENQQALGWAKAAEAKSSPAAQQTFENGLMIWRGDEEAIYILYSDNTWQRFPDTFRDGERESDPALAAPGGKLQPIRGFGKIWREQAGVRDRLGWATAKEQAVDAAVQDFDNGLLLRNGGLIYALIEQADGRRIWLVL